MLYVGRLHNGDETSKFGEAISTEVGGEELRRVQPVTASAMNAEVCLKETSGNARVVADLRQRVLHLLDQKHRAGKPLLEGQELDFGNDAQLAQHVERICLRDVPAGPAPPVSTATVHVHHMYDEEAAEETAGGEGDDEGSVAFQMFLLPAREFEGLWETLLYETDIKERLLRYVATAMRFSEMGEAAGSKRCPLGTAPAQLLCLLRARLVALGGVRSQGEKPAHRAPRHRLGCLSEPPPRSPISISISPPLSSQASTLGSSRGTGWCCCTARQARARRACARRWRRRSLSAPRTPTSRACPYSYPYPCPYSYPYPYPYP